MNPEDPPDDKELAQARALAEALEKPGRVSANIADALDTAELIRASRTPSLSSERSAAVLDRTRELASSKRKRRTRAVAAGGILAVAAAALLTFALPVAHESSAPPPQVAEGPAAVGGGPPIDLAAAESALLAAQRAWLDRPTPESTAALDTSFATYRTTHLAALQRRYAP